MHKKTVALLFCALCLITLFVQKTQAFASNVTLAWDPVSASTLAGYKMFVGTTSRTYGTPTNVGNVLTYTVSGLSAGTYYFAVTAYDTSGNESGYSNEATAVISAPGPVISNVSVTVIATNSATLYWQTDLASDAQADYGLTSAYGNSTTLNTNMVTGHTQNLSNLTANTTYHYRVKSKTATSSLAISGDFSFTSLPDTTAPAISNVTSSNITSTGATIGWITNIATDSQVDYGTTASYGNSTPLNATMVTSHQQILPGLAAGTLYHYRVKSKDGSGNTAVSSDFTFSTVALGDTTPPIVSAVAVSNVTNSAATIRWTTNEASNSQIEYGTTTAYGSRTTLNTNLVTSHSQTLSGLLRNTTYHYRVVSTDAAGNTSKSGDFSFRTRQYRYR
jgi:hypothetical protein